VRVVEWGGICRGAFSDKLLQVKEEMYDCEARRGAWSKESLYKETEVRIVWRGNLQRGHKQGNMAPCFGRGSVQGKAANKEMQEYGEQKC